MSKDIERAMKFYNSHPECDIWGIDPGQKVGIAKVYTSMAEDMSIYTRKRGCSITEVYGVFKSWKWMDYGILFVEWGTWFVGGRSASMSTFANPIIDTFKAIYGPRKTCIINVKPKDWQAARLTGVREYIFHKNDKRSKIKPTKLRSFMRCAIDGIEIPSTDHEADAYNILHYGLAELGVK